MKHICLSELFSSLALNISNFVGTLNIQVVCDVTLCQISGFSHFKYRSGPGDDSTTFLQNVGPYLPDRVWHHRRLRSSATQPWIP